jgi:transcriptional regulator with XRE-family HTH domain
MTKYFKVSLNRPNLEAGIIRHNLSRKELARELGVTRCYLTSIIYGAKEPSAAIRTRMLQYFSEYSFDDLFILEKKSHGKESSAK